MDGCRKSAYGDRIICSNKGFLRREQDLVFADRFEAATVCDITWIGVTLA